MNENLRYKTVQYNAQSIVRQIHDGRLVTQPDFKDIKKWSQIRKSQYIESIILGMPSQPIWCEETDTGDYLVIDGSARLNAIFEFIAEMFSLKNLRIRREYNRHSLRELPYHEILNIEDRFQLPFVIVNYDTSPELKAEFYWRLLESEKSFKSQSARNFAYRHALGFLKYIRDETSNSIEFVHTRQFFSLRENKESKIDETFLYLLLFTMMLEDFDFPLNENWTVENLLDFVMASLDSSSSEVGFWAGRTAKTIDRIAEAHGGPLRVLLGAATYADHSSIALHSFYITFIQSIRGEQIPPLHANSSLKYIHPTANAQRFFSFVKGIRR